MALDMQSIYILASGGSRAMEQLDTITNNLANVNTDGFKKLVIREMSQRLEENRSDANHLFVFPRFEKALVQKDQGALYETQNPLDFAIEGEGFFAIMTKDGTMYTRNAHFFLDPDGYVVDRNGNFLLDREGKKIRLDAKEPFSVAPDGTIHQASQPVARIAVEAFEEIEAVGDGYYRPRGAPKEPGYRIHQGFAERSNVDAVREISSMIVAHRRFEIYNNMIKTLDQMNQKTNEIAKA